MTLLANDLIMLDTLIQSFGHIEHQNPSIISEDIGRINVRCKICHGRNNSGIILDWLYTYLDKYYIHYICSSLLQSLDISVFRCVCTMVVIPAAFLEPPPLHKGVMSWNVKGYTRVNL